MRGNVILILSFLILSGRALVTRVGSSVAVDMTADNGIEMTCTLSCISLCCQASALLSSGNAHASIFQVCSVLSPCQKGDQDEGDDRIEAECDTDCGK